MEPVRAALRALGHQNWLRFGIRDRAIRAFFNPDSIEPYEFESEFFGRRYRGNLSSYIDWTVYFYGALEPGVLKLLADLASTRTDPVFLDIGANVGQHSLFMSTHAKEVHAFEPNPGVLGQFRDLIEQNGIDNIRVHPVGLGARDEELPFFSPQGANLGIGSFVKEHSSDNRETGRLTVKMADEYIAGLRLPHVDVVKIDVEGFEKNVLAGLRETLKQFRPKVVFEFSKTTKASFSSQAELMSLFPAGYSVSRIVDLEPLLFFFNKPGYSLRPFDFDRDVGNLLLLPEEAK